MKILKIFGIVVGIHVFALVLIFANPGCSSTTKPAPTPRETVGPSAPPPTFAVPNTAAAPAPSPLTPAPAPVTFNPDAPAMAAPSASGGGVRFVPTRPNTAVAGTLVAEPVADVTPATTYVVKSGDNLWSIAKKQHLTASELAAANGIATSAVVRPGQKLVIPGKAGAAASAAPAPAAKGPVTGSGRTAESAATPAPARAGSESVRHVVKSGETLGTIARNYGVRQGDIAVANNISDPAKIRAGMELIIPGWQPTAGKSGKAGAKSGGAAKPTDSKAAGVESSASPAPAAPPPIPIIRIDDNPITPAPKS